MFSNGTRRDNLREKGKADAERGKKPMRSIVIRKITIEESLAVAKTIPSIWSIPSGRRSMKEHH